jgi:hypothetical protein
MTTFNGLKRFIGWAMAVAAICLTAAGAAAQTQPLVQKSFPTQLFEPAIGPNGLLTVEPAGVAGHLEFDVDLYLNYQHKPLTVHTEPPDEVGVVYEEDVNMVENQMTGDLTGSFGLEAKWFRFQVGFGLPVNLFVMGTDLSPTGATGDDFSVTALGDLRLQAKLLLLDDLEGFSLGIAPIVTVPTACLEAGGKPCDEKGKFGGDPNLTFRPRLLMDYQVGDFLLALNAGWLFRQKSMVLATTVGNRLLYGLGASYRFGDWFSLITEIFGQVGFEKGGCRDVGFYRICDDTSGVSPENVPVEIALAGRVHLGYGFDLTAGVGVGATRAIGSPVFRGLLGVQWSPTFADTDKDGIKDTSDSCPTEAEDFDGFEDEDGCPELDNDNDGFLDVNDKCPYWAEDKDTFEDGDGCPEEDNDGDGIKDGYDACPMTAEDRDGWDDEDGCPDPDNDRDGIPDTEDKCPAKRETINGRDDDDGCPDAGEPGVWIEGERILTRKRIRFNRKGRVDRRSYGTLRQLALLIKANPDIESVRITVTLLGRSKSVWADRRAVKMAEAIQRYLVKRGIESEKLNTMSSVRKSRRRGEEIEFEILRGEPEPQVY